MIAADRRIKDEIVLFVGHGNLDADEIDNPGLAVMMSRLDGYATRAIAEHDAWCDSVEVAMMTRIAEDYPELAGAVEEYLTEAKGSDTRAKYGEEYELVELHRDYGPWTTASRIAPMIPVEWGQTVPFNAKASQELGKQVYTGCVATASIQLMAYWKKPETFHGQSIDWVTTRTHRTAVAISEDARATIRNTLADVFWNFGEDVNMDWGEIGVEGSGATSQVAINVLAANGFATTTKRNYSYNPVISSLQNSRPVYMRGNSHKTEHKFLGINWWSTYKGGHAWLIDGYLKQKQVMSITYACYPKSQVPTPHTRAGIPQTITHSFASYREFFHNNFGWDGTSNGYYTTGVFDSNNGADLPSNTRSGVDGNFIYELEMWTDIR